MSKTLFRKEVVHAQEHGWRRGISLWPSSPWGAGRVLDVANGRISPEATPAPAARAEAAARN